ncbi:NAD(P)H-dependent oxidoreductase [Budviciaceae bacterium BWR-B9]|uniref:FMN dependent NADH:quinone oxidoreductase n=1 Tax=Limnobaculum allomyrinae TaxID=2791986 RepID=A0ABS1ITA9_9GAMM|nr:MULTISPECIES: NAD(P)H-dependent oxidoreductase [Limnobaculum]MBK5145008.1 NAD(P)H-dependent oxidoreductase [Limnobaculum allomyrinae]MBV7692839.1 NAD(P)H-dependent oxidoreductase [Limnobaculum sp. M2-1]
MNILHIDSSPFIENSVSRELSAAIVTALQRTEPEVNVVYQDYGTNPPPHLSAEAMTCQRSHQSTNLSDNALAEIAAVNQAIEQLKMCDVLVIGSPMYNHSISSHLKTWLDLICQAGKTFRYASGGPVGLLKDRPVFIASSRGGIYSRGEGLAHDFQEPYLVSMLGTLGLKDIHMVRAEGVSMSHPGRDVAVANAMQQISQMFNLPAMAQPA